MVTYIYNWLIKEGVLKKLVQNWRIPLSSQNYDLDQIADRTEAVRIFP